MNHSDYVYNPKEVIILKSTSREGGIEDLHEKKNKDAILLIKLTCGDMDESIRLII